MTRSYVCVIKKAARQHPGEILGHSACGFFMIF